MQSWRPDPHDTGTAFAFLIQLKIPNNQLQSDATR